MNAIFEEFFKFKILCSFFFDRMELCHALELSLEFEDIFFTGFGHDWSVHMTSRRGFLF
jgi:hypothetical protein